MGVSSAAACRAPSGGLSSLTVGDEDLITLLGVDDRQPPPGDDGSWGIVVLRRCAAREVLTDLVRRGAEEVAALRRPCAPGTDPAVHRDRCRAHAEAEVAGMMRAPVWLCTFLGPNARSSIPRGAHSLALTMERVEHRAASMGLRTISTIRHLRHEEAVQSLLGLPPAFIPDVAVALGYPDGGPHAPLPRPSAPDGPPPRVFAERFRGPDLGG